MAVRWSEVFWCFEQPIVSTASALLPFACFLTFILSLMIYQEVDSNPKP